MRFGWRSPGAGATSSALVALAALGVAVQISDVPAVDRAAKSWVAHHSFDGLAAALVPLTWISGWLPVALALGGVGLVLSLHRHTIRPAIVIAASLATAVVTTFALKVLLARPGPTGVVPLPRDGAWPSGHTVAITLCTAVVLRSIEPSGRRSVKVLRRALPLLPVLVGAALVYRGDHWVTDVLAGLLLGYVSARPAAGLTTLRPGAHRTASNKVRRDDGDPDQTATTCTAG